MQASNNKGVFSTILLLFMLSGCASFSSSPLDEPPEAEPSLNLNTDFKPLREPRHLPEQKSQPSSQDQYQTRFEKGPEVIITSQIADLQSKELLLDLQGENISGNYHNVPLPAFINELFGEQLGLSFTLEPQISKQKDLVTLRLKEPVTPSELFRIARDMLSAYGVAITQRDDVLAFSIDKNIIAGETPLLVSGRALPEVPDSHRPAFMFVPLKVVTNVKVSGWVREALKGKDIIIKEDPVRNAVLLKGKPDLVNQALAIIEVLDQPLMRGKFSTRIAPAYVKVDALTKDLEQLLQAEGYDASTRPPIGAVMLIPLKASNQLIVFAASEQIIEHIREWVTIIDRRQQLSIDEGIFSYTVNNTRAQHIVELLKELDSGASSTGEDTKLSSAGGRFVVDGSRNTVIFKGSGQAWLELLPVIREMDQAPPSVLVEVLLAEVTLSDQEKTGFEFLARGSAEAGGSSYNSLISTLGGLGLGGSGLTATLNSAGETRAILNLFYENNRAEIRSRPRLMVKSGEEAFIDVGTEIPIITSNSQSADNEGAPIIQTVEYRKTGVSLRIRPVVHASGYVDIEVLQELSEAQPNQSSDIDSPSIFNRQIQTTVTLRDGGSILLGGLISKSRNSGDKGVPWISKIPLLGKLFKVEAESDTSTELIVMIIPYVVRDPKEGQELTNTLLEAIY